MALPPAEDLAVVIVIWSVISKAVAVTDGAVSSSPMAEEAARVTVAYAEPVSFFFTAIVASFEAAIALVTALLTEISLQRNGIAGSFVTPISFVSKETGTGMTLRWPISLRG